MSRIPEEELERLKREIDLVALIRSKGIVLKPHGSKDLIGLCPFHDDKNPSLVVTPDKNLWHCFGCGKGSTVIDWIMEAEGVSFRHSVELLRSGNASSLVASDKILGKTTVPRLQAPVALDADDQTAIRQVVDYYHETLKRTPEALQYLESRGIKSEEALNRFKIGYADRTLGLRLPNKNRKEGSEIRGRLERIGIYRESGHEHMNGAVVFPIMDENGIISGLYGRKIRDYLRVGTAYHLYLPGPHRGFWNSPSLAATCVEHGRGKEIILCEAIIDALSFWVNGFRNVTAAYGVNGFTDEMLHAFIDRRVQRVYIAFDRDEAGESAADRIAALLTGEGIECLRVQFPKGMDANEYARAMKPAAKTLQVLINAAVWLGKRSAPALEQADVPVAPAPASAPAPEADLQPQSAAPVPEHEPPPPTEPPPTDADFLSLAASSPLPEPLPAAENTTEPAPNRDKINVPCRINGEDIEISLGVRSYRIRGLQRNLSYDVLKVNIRVLQDERYYVDSLDLYNARHRAAFINAAADELQLEVDTLKRDVGRVLLKLEELQEQNIKATLKPEKPQVKLTPEQYNAAMALLKDPDLLNRIARDILACGIVGERINAITGFIAAVSRKLEKPLGIIVQSSSAAGKTSLMDAILAFMPPEDKIKYSAMTGQSLFYMGETDLKHKILAIVEEEGAEKASYALKLLQSEGEISIASTGKDPASGKLITHEYRVEGPVMIFLTTTAVEIDEELQNRCIVLSIDEGREQTKAIHQIQRQLETLDGLSHRQTRTQILELYRNAQRLLRPVEVINPYAPRLTFLDDRTRTRRDHTKYLILIKAFALLHQYQRPVKQQGDTRYIEATLEDIEAANSIANEIFGRSLDELPPQSRRLLLMLDGMVKEACQTSKMIRSDYRFTRKDVRRFTRWSDFQVRIHLERLVVLEYAMVHRGCRGQTMVYELLYDGKGQDGKPFILGLIDVEELRKEEKKRLNEKDSTES
jgi:DNA primase